jgi:anthranilate synthase component 2
MRSDSVQKRWFNIDEIAEFDKILLSPGPEYLKKPDYWKISFGNTVLKSILGVCLGQQAIGEVYGGTLSNLKKVYHGIAMVKR